MHIIGPFSIHTFGLFIAVGIILFSILFLRDPRRKKIISNEQYYSILSYSILAGFIGGRILYALPNWQELPSFWTLFAFWEGGFSLLGGIIALLITIPFLLKKEHLEPFPLLDIASIYAPLLQAISRVGCYFAGCCFGIPIGNAWSITGFCPDTLHPTQLYSASILFGIFLFLYFCAKNYYKKPGQITCIYLFLMGTERFFIDFLRADREFVAISNIFSLAQIIALILMASSTIGFIFITHRARQKT